MENVRSIDSLGKHERCRGYLDYNASVPMPEEVISAVERSMRVHYGNGSSIHRQGRLLRGEIVATKAKLADYMSCEASEIIFTSGATESNNFVLQGLEIDKLLVVRDGHESLLQPALARGVPIVYIDLGAEGLVDKNSYRKALAQAGTKALLVLTLVNGETGVIQDIVSLAAMAKNDGVWLHVDGTQALGCMDLRLGAWGVDSFSFSAHKVGGLSGVGGLYLCRQRSKFLRPLLLGGAQENGRRSGSYDVHGLVALRSALGWLQTLEKAGEHQRLGVLRNNLERRLRELLGEVIILGEKAPRTSHVSSMVMAKHDAQQWLIEMDMAGICVSSGAACSSGKVGISKTVQAMGLDDEKARRVIRVSLGWASTVADVDMFLAVVKKVVERKDV